MAPKDIAAKATELLGIARVNTYMAHYLLGPRDYSMQEAAAILGQAISLRALRYVQFSYEDVRKGLLHAGMSESMANLFDDMIRTSNDSQEELNHRIPTSTTPTTLEEFAQTVFAPAFQQAK